MAKKMIIKEMYEDGLSKNEIKRRTNLNYRTVCKYAEQFDWNDEKLPYLKSISIHTSVNKSLAYILNPDKTENMLYTTSINCTTNADQAYNQMRLVYEQFAKDKFSSPKPLEGKP